MSLLEVSAMHLSCPWLGFPFVTGLLKSRCPATIARFIISVIVDSVQSQLRRARSHIRQKVLESLPAFANRNPSATIVRPLGGVGVQAAPFHCRPNPVFGAILSTRGISMRGLSLCRDLAIETTATPCKTLAQIAAHDDRLIAAIAKTQPIRILLFLRGSCNYQKPLKAAADEVVGIAHV